MRSAMSARSRAGFTEAKERLPVSAASARPRSGSGTSRKWSAISFSLALRDGVRSSLSSSSAKRFMRPRRRPQEVSYVAPLCPAGHLPHKGGDRLSPVLSPIPDVAGRASAELKADLPPRGGDVRQDRGGREGAS